MPAFIRSDVQTILPLLQAHLMAFTGFPIERVVMQKNTALTEQATLQGDQIIVICPQGEGMVRPQIQSAGRHDARVNRQITITGWNRLNTDVSFQDQDWLLSTAYGYMPFESAMMNALVCWFPQNGSQDILAVPTRCESISAPQTTRDDWGAASVAVNYQLYRALNQQVIFPGAQ
jgi:hypothetical protein